MLVCWGRTVSDMLADIRCRGDEAVREYVRRFQGAEIGALEVSPEEMAEAEAAVSSELKEAIAVAGENISLSMPRKQWKRAR